MVRFLQASGHKVFLNQQIRNLVLYVILCKGTLFSIYRWFINVEFTEDSTITHVSTELIKHEYFSVRYIIVLLCLETLDSTAALCWRAFKRQNHQQKHKNAFQNGTKHSKKRTLVCILRANTRKQKMVSLDLS